MIRLGKILGVRQGGEPDNYLDHFYTSKQCGQLVDKRDLGQVFHHEVPATSHCRRTDAVCAMIAGPMSSDSLWIQIPLIIGIPVLALWIITLIKGATGAKRPGRENAVDLGMDYAVLATGACGSIFANDTLYKTWGMAAAVYGIGTTLLCIVFIGILARMKRWHNRNISAGRAAWYVILGMIPIGLVTAILIIGYTVTPRR